MIETIVGIFSNLYSAMQACSDLTNLGFGMDHVSIVARDDKSEYARFIDTHVKPEREKDIGTGVAIGGVSGLLIGLALLAIPGLGPIVAAGPVIGALSGATLGAAAGGLIAALKELDIPEAEAKSYDQIVGDGNTLIVIRAPQTYRSQITNVLRKHGAVKVESHSTGPHGQVETLA